MWMLGCLEIVEYSFKEVYYCKEPGRVLFWSLHNLTVSCRFGLLAYYRGFFATFIFQAIYSVLLDAVLAPEVTPLLASPF